jgi:signal transduction histidine kinase
VTLSVLAAILATTLFGVPLAAVAARYFIDDERAELERIADTVAVAAAGDLARGGLPARLPDIGDDIDIAFYAADGRRLSGDGPAIGDGAVAQARQGAPGSERTAGHVAVALPLTAGRTVTGVVRVASDYADVRRRIVWTWAAMLALGTLAVTATWLVARRQARRLTAPVEALSQIASELGAGDFSVRTAPTGIPEIDSVGRSLDSTAERLGALVHRERAFSADASHQLRTPLTGLRLALETALDSPGADLRQAADAAIDAADRLERTIDDLLTLAREPRREAGPLPIGELTGALAQTWRPVLAAQGRPLRIDIDTEVPVATAAPAAVRQILGVLLDNAVRHGAGAVVVTVRDAGGAVALDVADDGPGVDGADLPVRPRDGATGHGIGLALARELAEAEGGRLRLTCPAPPVFTLLLPLAGPGED